MGGFILAKRDNGLTMDETEESLGNLLDIFNKKNLPLNRKVVTGDYVIYVYHKYKYPVENVLTFDDDRFIIATGSLIYDGKTGCDALISLYDDFSEDCSFLSKTLGQYCLIVSKNGKLYLLNDSAGIYPVYTDISGTVISSSFLAVFKSLKKKTIAPQELYEFLFSETFHGNKTLIQEIDTVDRTKMLLLSKQTSIISKKPTEKTIDGTRSVTELIEQVSDSLLDYFTILKNNFGDSICSAISGGFDSRLMLAAMRKVGIKPYLYVYGNDTSTDVRIAKLIAEGEKLPLKYENNNNYVKRNPKEFMELLEQYYYWFDGLGYEFGVFDTGFDMYSRLKRADNARLQLHGAGGEVFRNRLSLPERSYDLLPVLKATFDNMVPSLVTDAFDAPAYFDSLQQKCRPLFDNRIHRLNRQEIEIVYPLFILNYWLGHNTKINNQFVYTIYPFSEISNITMSLDIPVSYKKQWAFNAALITAIDPALASYPSQYGFRFSEYNNIPFMIKYKNNLKTYAPPSLKAYVRKHFWKRVDLGKDKFPYYFEKEYLETIFPSKELRISEYINIDSIVDSTMLARALSVELLMNDRF